MKKLFLSAIALMAVVSFSYAQTFEKGDNLLKVGIGLNSYPLSAIPFGASYEIGVSNSISIGANVDYLDVSDYDLSVLYLGVRGAYHANFDIPNLDVYGGLIIGYKKVSITGDYGAIVNGTYAGGFVGATYYLGKSFGLFAELGATGVTNVRTGLALKF